MNEKIFLVKEKTIDKTSNRFWQIDRQKGNPTELTKEEIERIKSWDRASLFYNRTEKMKCKSNNKILDEEIEKDDNLLKKIEEVIL